MNSLFTKMSVTMMAVAALGTSTFAAEGTVDVSGTLRLREESNTSSAVLANLPNGTKVDVSAVTEDGWYQVNYDNKTGYVSGEYLVVSAENYATLPVLQAPVYGHVIAGPLNVREQAGTNFAPVNILNKGTVVEVIHTVEGWYQTEEGFISAEYVEIVDKDTAVTLKEAANKAKQASSLPAQIVEYANQFLGYRYVYGGNSPSGFDCSGFVQYVYKNFGVSLNRSSRDQYSNGVAVSKSDLQPGDVLFFSSSGGSITHVGLYIGNNQFIHASTPSTGVIISSLSQAYYTSGYVGARRMV